MAPLTQSNCQELVDGVLEDCVVWNTVLSQNEYTKAGLIRLQRVVKNSNTRNLWSHANTMNSLLALASSPVAEKLGLLDNGAGNSQNGLLNWVPNGFFNNAPGVGMFHGAAATECSPQLGCAFFNYEIDFLDAWDEEDLQFKYERSLEVGGIAIGGSIVFKSRWEVHNRRWSFHFLRTGRTCPHCRGRL